MFGIILQGTVHFHHTCRFEMFDFTFHALLMLTARGCSNRDGRCNYILFCFAYLKFKEYEHAFNFLYPQRGDLSVEVINSVLGG